MPFIHIKSLPFEQPFSVEDTIITIATEFSKVTNINLCHIHTTWEFYQPGHYAKGDKTTKFQPENNFPIIVDLHTPDFNDMDTIEIMLKSIAKSISQQLSFPINNIFINHHQAYSGRIFDDGEIVKW